MKEAHPKEMLEPRGVPATGNVKGNRDVRGFRAGCDKYRINLSAIRDYHQNCLCMSES